MLKIEHTIFRGDPSHEAPADFLPLCLIDDEDSRRAENNLYRFFVSRFGSTLADCAFDLYRVRTSKHFRNSNGLATAFPQIDRLGNLRQIKVMAYNPETGKRLHKQDTAEKWSAKHGKYFTDTDQDKIYFAGKYLSGEESPSLQQCFFGEHLIKPGARVGIVESEKTAMIATIYQPDICWIATGGKNGVRLTKSAIMAGLSGAKSVTLFPDLGCVEEWHKKKDIISSCGITCTVSEYLETIATREEANAGLDIADFLLKEEPSSRQAGMPTSRSTTNEASSNKRIKAFLDDSGRLYIPTPPDGCTFTVYKSVEEYEAVRDRRTNGYTKAHIERRTGEEYFKEEILI